MVYRLPPATSVALPCRSPAARALALWISGISVQSWKQVSDSEKREHHDGEAENREVGGAASTPPPRDPHVQVAGINQPGDCGPGLLRIPAPIRAPGPIRPVRAGGNHQRQQGEGNANSL